MTASQQNMSILHQNTLHGLSGDAGTLYMRGAARDDIKAHRCACEWDDRLAPCLWAAIPVAVRNLVEQKPSLASEVDRAAREVLEFARERHYRRYFPDGRSS